MRGLNKEILKNKLEFIKSINCLAVVGAGVSGMGLVRLVKDLGKKVLLSEVTKDIPLDRINCLESMGVEFELGAHSSDFLGKADLIILSPGIDPEAFRKDYLQGIDTPFVGEIEFSYWFCRSKNLIAITGTNGKTTTTFLVSQILKKNTDRVVHTLGNIGSPFSESVLGIKEDDLVVLEISSFQLETIITFKPRIACLLNFSPDHLDRYLDLDSYFKAKKRIFMNQDSSCYSLFPAELENCLGELKAKKIAIVDNSNIAFMRKIIGIQGLDQRVVDDYLLDFKGLAHRLEQVATKGGIKFVNDSKATNVESTIFALNKIKGPVILLLGGKDKGLDYSLIRPHLGKVKKIFLIGDAKEKIRKSLSGAVELEEASCLEEATSLAYKIASGGDTVLLSPMCSSFDMFSDYKQRGEVFKRAVFDL